jgi:hypothetical protein
MIPRYRQKIFRIFSVFFILVAPFLIIYSLGYNLKLQSKGSGSSLEIENTLDFRIETFPSGARLYNHENQILDKTPGDLMATDNQVLQLKIEKEEYVEEKFTLWAEPDKNTSVKITKLFLLPKNSEEVEDFAKEILEPLTILSNKYVLFTDQDKLFVGTYSFGQFLDQREEVATNVKRKIFPGKWKLLQEDTYWNLNQQLIITRFEGKWFLKDFEEMPFRVISAAKIDETNCLILDENGKLWNYDFEEDEYSFLTNHIDGLTYTSAPDNIWLLQGEKIFSFTRNREIINNSFDLSQNIYSTNNQLLLLRNSVENVYDYPSDYFAVKNSFQGIIFKIADNLFYVPDSNKQNWRQLAEEVKLVGSQENLVIWLDEKDDLFVFNFFPEDYKYLGKVKLQGDFKQMELNYYAPWKRILVYSESQVYSAWYDKEIPNPSITKYYPSLWINDASCFGNVYEKYQFCLRDNKLINYKNNSLSFF